jgi:hypothetical protein
MCSRDVFDDFLEAEYKGGFDGDINFKSGSSQLIHSIFGGYTVEAFDGGDEPTPVINEPTPVVTESKPVVNESTPIVTESKPVVNEPTLIITESKPVVNEPTPVVSTVTTVPVAGSLIAKKFIVAGSKQSKKETTYDDNDKSNEYKINAAVPIDIDNIKHSNLNDELVIGVSSLSMLSKPRYPVSTKDILIFIDD